MPTADPPRVWNKRDPNVPPDAVYVGRPTKWGNPFRIATLGGEKHGGREESISRYRDMLTKGFAPQLVEDEAWNRRYTPTADELIAAVRAEVHRALADPSSSLWPDDAAERAIRRCFERERKS